MDEVVEASRQVVGFCRSKGDDGRLAYWLGLYIEEMATNSILHGYENSSRPHIASVRVLYDDGTYTLRIRDNGVRFDPVEWSMINEVDPDNPARGVGIRLVCASATDIGCVRIVDSNYLIINIEEDDGEAGLGF